MLRWDAWPVTTEDYDLYLIRSSGQHRRRLRHRPVRTARTPVEAACYQNPTGSVDHACRRDHEVLGGETPRFDLFVDGTLEYQTSGRERDRAGIVAGRARGRRGVLVQRRGRGLQLARPDDRRPAQAGARRARTAFPARPTVPRGAAAASRVHRNVGGGAARCGRARPAQAARAVSLGAGARDDAASERAKPAGSRDPRAATARGAVACRCRALASGEVVFARRALSGRQPADLDHGGQLGRGRRAHGAAMDRIAPRFSPDGSRIAFQRDRAVRTGRHDGRRRQRRDSDCFPGSTDDEAPAWSPDGTGSRLSRVGTCYHVVVTNADGTNPTQLTTEASDDLAPAWAPDGSTIFFLSTRDDDPRTGDLSDESRRNVPKRASRTHRGCPSATPAFAGRDKARLRRRHRRTSLRMLDGIEPGVVTISDTGRDGDRLLVARRQLELLISSRAQHRIA